LLNGTFFIIVDAAGWCKTVSKTSLTAGSINSSPMVWAFPDLAINFDILYEANKPSSHFFLKKLLASLRQTVPTCPLG
jgi:hypothetical protein